jgi:hypothetical protein
MKDARLVLELEWMWHKKQSRRAVISQTLEVTGINHSLAHHLIII